MKKSLSILVFSSCIFFSAKAQFSRYLVEFRDKRGTPFALSNPSAFLSSASIQRRDRQNIGIDSTDLPVTPSYINSVLSIPGVQFLNLSKWFNQVLIKISDSTILQQINSFSF